MHLWQYQHPILQVNREGLEEGDSLAFMPGWGMKKVRSPSEYAYAAPIATGLTKNAAFRKWVLSKSAFCEFEDARLLNQEIAAHRKSKTAEWWRHHYRNNCCEGCRGQETDIFTVFESEAGERFSIHFEVKYPGDRFGSKLQSRNYDIRAQCWTTNPPRAVLPHQRASAGIFFSETNRAALAVDLIHFATLVTFEDIEAQFPEIATWRE